MSLRQNNRVVRARFAGGRAAARASPSALEAIVARPRPARRADRWRSARGCSARPATSSTPTSRSGGAGARRVRRQREGGEGSSATRRCSPRPASACCASKPVFTTPNVFPPDGFEQARRRRTSPTFREVVEPQHCYVCKQHYSSVHHFYDQLCPACARVQLRASAPSSADLRGRVALLTGGRVKIGYQAGHQAAARRRAPHRHHALPARLGGALRARSPTSPSGATGSRSSGSTCATRRASRRSAAHLLATRDRLDFIVNNACQTVRRPPDFYEHMMDGETAALERRCRRTCAQLLGAYEGLRGYDMLPAGRAGARRRRRRRRSSGVTRAAELSQVPLLPEERAGAARPLPRGPARPGPAAGRSARAQLVAAAARRGADGRAARGAARQRGRAVRPQRAAQAADAAHARARQAHRQRVGGRGAVLPAASRPRGIRTRTWRRRRST